MGLEKTVVEGETLPLDDIIVEIRNMTFSRGSRLIFDDVSLKIPRGKVTAIMGPSGTGKTTLLKLIGGQLLPDSGQILLEGQNIPTLSRRDLFIVRERMGMLFQSGALFTDMNVFDNVAFPIRVHTELPEEMIRDIVLMKLQAVGLRGAVSLMPSELSGGMARRVALARAISLDPDIVMYDEPFTGQDPIAMGVLVNLIKRLNEALGHTSIIVSHDIQETLSIADYIYVLSDGKIIAQGTPAALKQQDSAQVRQFVEGLPDGPVPFHYPAPDLHEQLMAGGVFR
ncbi:MAG: ATP-binding cassette domain-containing protein [Nitrincola lacisaponensis]|uniref:Putative ABC transporter, ATP-binding protein YrbF n=1 Tax=Nitrincola lacisaponensis TaxID=267850 RepID=A0A063Y6K8_9GAMM|nr:ATP-binding cassette domain-containing protein [Nitrincola lacisaponensis]KDE40780.1 putative ABC transporter, ATP-binding protein YrbF [Nitrincola lacisaponensis]